MQISRVGDTFKVVSETLSNNSIVYNIKIIVAGTPVEIGCPNEETANRLANELNKSCCFVCIDRDPQRCPNCGSIDFERSGDSEHCGTCGK